MNNALKILYFIKNINKFIFCQNIKSIFLYTYILFIFYMPNIVI